MGLEFGIGQVIKPKKQRSNRYHLYESTVQEKNLGCSYKIVLWALCGQMGVHGDEGHLIVAHLERLASEVTGERRRDMLVFNHILNLLLTVPLN